MLRSLRSSPADILSLSAAFSLCFAANVQAAILVSVSYTTVETEVSPRIETIKARHSINYLMEGHSVHMSSDINEANDGLLGHSHAAQKVGGGSFLFRSNISQHRLVFEEIYPTETILTTVQTDGKASCNAKRSSRLHPGEMLYKHFNKATQEHILISSRNYEDVICAISQ